LRLQFILLASILFSSVGLTQNQVPLIVESKNGLDIIFTFDEESYSQKISSNRTVIEYFNSADISSPGTPILPSKTYFIAIPPNSKISFSLSDKRYGLKKNVECALNPQVSLSGDSTLVYNESKPDLSKFTADQYPLVETEVIGYTWVRDYYCAIIKINTHSFNWKKKEIRELQSCRLSIEFDAIMAFNINSSPQGEFDGVLDKIILNYKSAAQFRSFRPETFIQDSSGNWIDYSKEYVKLQIAEDGIYRIDYDQLVSYGINPQTLNPKTLKMFFKGEVLPIFVFGEEDLSFDQGDYIEFWAEKNYGDGDYKHVVESGQDYINYLDRYSDTSIVWLSWDGNIGTRIKIQDTTTPGLTDTLSSHTAFIHFENDERLWYYDPVVPRVQLPFWQENKVWTGHVIAVWGIDSSKFFVSNFVPGSEVNVTARLISRYTDQLFTNNHRFGLSLNSSSPQDTIVFSYRETVNFEGSYNSSQLLNGNNSAILFGMQNDSLRWHDALIDWVDVDYKRFNVAVNDSLWLRVSEGIQTAERVIRVENILQPQSDILIYKIKPDYKKIESFILSNSVITFTDTVTSGDEYFIIKQNSVREPIFQSKKFFVNLRDENNGADNIIISNRFLESSSQDYLNFIESNYSLRSELVFVDDIFDEFSFGYDKPEAIRDFLHFAYLNWSSPSPSYLLLLGDANYDYKKKLTPPPSIERKNLVPSYGYPVSDSWFTMWDTLNVNLQQMFVGRIPTSSNAEVNNYLQKHQIYLNRNYDDFNKRYLFFSGGDAADSLQLALLKAANDFVLNNIVKPVPVGGEGYHFYKTKNPPTNFGPYSQEYINNAIDSSGLFISYIGHSGTETWDNGITEVTDLQSAFDDRYSLISDFGCSTGKFAEPDVEAFGELFVSASQDGQAIAYLGNASWGYTSTSINFPRLFYEQLVLDSSLVISEAHFLAKYKLLNQYGTGDVNKVFSYSNIFFGDPLISFRLPPKPNYSVTAGSFTLNDAFPIDINDSVQVKINLINFGEVEQDSLLFSIQDFYLGNQIYFREFKIPAVSYKKDITISVPIFGMVGEHTLRVELDKNNLIDEIYEEDNSADYNFIVYSTSVRPIEAESYYNAVKNSFRFLNPVLLANENISTMKIAFSENVDFSNSTETVINLDTVVSVLNTSPMQPDKRYWWRAKLNSPQASWSEPFSFYNENINYDWYFNHSFNNNEVHSQNVKFDSTNNTWKLTNFVNILEISSAGSNDGEYGSIKFNDFERLPNTFYWGIATAIIDSITLEPSDFNYFLYWNSYSDTLLINYIDSLPNGTLLAMTICADGVESVLGFSQGTPVRRAIETLGSLYVDSVLYRDSWCMIGKKGAPIGSVPESFSRRFSGPASLDTSITVFNQNGWVEFPIIKNSSQWINVTKSDSLIPGTSISYTPLGITNNNTIDTLSTLFFSGDVADLSNIDADTYTSLKLFAEFSANQNYETPSLKTIGINFIPVPELAINYQVVSIADDSVTLGEDVRLQFFVYNVGESNADSFNVKVEVINEDNSRQTIFTQRIASLSFGEINVFNLTHNTSSGSGSKSFLISIDPDNEVRELFEDNNFFTIPFYIKPDTTIPTIAVTIDGNDILDGEYISSDPVIHIELTDESLLPITDPSSIMIYLNDELIPSDTSIISYEFSENNPKIVVDYMPSLDDGEYALKVLWRDYEGNIVDSSGVEKFFLVSNEAKLLNVYNYPNPTSGETHFTFKLTQIPEEIKIKIFTIAGRLVKELKLTSNELKYDFNKIYWDGRDEDGDVLANGVYLYKVIMKAGNNSEEVTQKLAVVR
jgi:hypothetical protein